MYIYVDESGTFVQPNAAHKVSAIGALVIPEAQHRPLLRAFERLIAPWRGQRSEIKGSQLSERQVAAVIDLAREYDVVFQVCAIDMGMHDPQTVEGFRQVQADGIVANITPEYPNWWSWATNLRQQVLTLSPQLFVQAIVIVHLLGDVLHNATNYYALRWPRALEKFSWHIDAKDMLVTPFEKLWAELLLPMLQSRSIRDPIAHLTDANYRYFERFEMGSSDVPSPMREQMESAGRSGAIDLRKVYREHFEFAASHRSSGIKMVDILVNATTRALNNTLSESGWKHLGNLMVNGVRPGFTLVKLASDGACGVYDVVTPYGSVVRKFNEQRRELIPANRGA